VEPTIWPDGPGTQPSISDAGDLGRSTGAVFEGPLPDIVIPTCTLTMRFRRSDGSFSEALVAEDMNIARDFLAQWRHAGHTNF
jgi:hypothetical protein